MPPAAHNALDVPPSTPGSGMHSQADSALQLVAAGITELVGFKVAAINVVRNDELEVVAVGGTDSGMTPDGRAVTLDEMLGSRWPVSVLEENLAISEDWGMFKFLPHDRIIPPEGAHWIMDTHMIDAPDAWHPLDELIAPIYDDAGNLRGALSIDGPANGLRPERRKRRVLEHFARRTRRILLSFLERERLAERAANLHAARDFLREAGSHLSLSEVLDASQDRLINGLDADGLWIEAVGPAGEPLTYASPGVDWQPTAYSFKVWSEVTSRAWTRGTYSITSATTVHGSPEWGRHADLLLDFYDAVGAESSLMVPIGADQEWLGHIVLLRAPGRPVFSDAEGRLAMELGHDFGRLVLTSNAYTKELDLAEKLRQADHDHSRLIEAVSRELRLPLSALETGLTALQKEDRRSLGWIIQLESLAARTSQLDSIVSDLLLFSRISDPRTRVGNATVELGEMVYELLEDRAHDSEQRGIYCSMERPIVPAHVRGEPRELTAAVRHLLENAVTHGHRGSQVTVQIRSTPGEVTLIVDDTGVGISPAERPKVFDAFFRGTNPALGGSRGAGLGLTIVQEVARRHRGRVTLDSTAGVGTRVTLTLPAAS